MEEVPGTQEQSPYNLRTNFEATKEAMAYVEQGGWLKSEERIAKDFTGVDEGQRLYSLEGARQWLAAGAPGRMRTVYGDGGVNRWFVYPDGRICLSKFHANDAKRLARAQEKGFWIE
jgi:hypothetical protein